MGDGPNKVNSRKARLSPLLVGLSGSFDGPGWGDCMIRAGGGGVNHPGNLSSKKTSVPGETTNFGVVGLSGVVGGSMSILRWILRLPAVLSRGSPLLDVD